MENNQCSDGGCTQLPNIYSLCQQAGLNFYLELLDRHHRSRDKFVSRFIVHEFNEQELQSLMEVNWCLCAASHDAIDQVSRQTRQSIQILLGHTQQKQAMGICSLENITKDGLKQLNTLNTIILTGWNRMEQSTVVFDGLHPAV